MLCPETASLSKGNLSPFILNERGDFRARYKNSNTIQKQHI